MHGTQTTFGRVYLELFTKYWFKHCATCLQSAIGSVAAAAEQAFNPYAGRVLEAMKFFMVLTNDEDLRARARSTELVGIVAMSVGKQGMEPIFPPFIDAAIAVIALLFLYCRFRGRKNSPS